MTEREALLAAVCANPHDDMPRIMYAHWLKENGDAVDQARAELIHLQLERARCVWNSSPWLAYWQREKALLSTCEPAWRTELPVEKGWTWGKLDRGFVQELSIYPESVQVADPARAFAATPLSVLSFFDSHIGPWMPYLRRISDLCLGDCPLTDAEVAALCAPDLGLRLRRILIVGSEQFEPAAWEMLVTRFGRDAIEHF